MNYLIVSIGSTVGILALCSWQVVHLKNGANVHRLKFLIIIQAERVDSLAVE